MSAPGSPLSVAGAPRRGCDAPFEPLEDCHVRMQLMLRLMQRLRLHLASMGCDEQARQAARDVMRFFDSDAPAHRDHEERHVFPPLLAAGSCVDTVRRLQREHLEMAQLWPPVRNVLQRVGDGDWPGFAPDDEALLEGFARLHDWHIAAENELVYPAAAQLLDAAACSAMAEQIARRR